MVRDQNSPPPPIVVTTNPLASIDGSEHRDVRTETITSSASSDFGDGTEVRNRRGGSLFHGIFNRMRIAAYMSRSRRAQAGNEAEPDVSAVLGDFRLEEIRLMRPETLAPIDSRPGYNRQHSSKSIKSNKLTISHSHQHLVPTESVGMGSTTRNYTLGKGSVHFYRNFAQETEVRRCTLPKKMIECSNVTHFDRDIRFLRLVMMFTWRRWLPLCMASGRCSRHGLWPCSSRTLRRLRNGTIHASAITFNAVC